MKRGHSNKSMRVIGLMSGTSADGIDVAIARISGAPPSLSASIEHSMSVPFPPDVRARILTVANGAASSSAEISELNFSLGNLFGQAVIDACRHFRVPISSIALVGSHGQTIFHQGYAGRTNRKLHPESSTLPARCRSANLQSSPRALESQR